LSNVKRFGRWRRASSVLALTTGLAGLAVAPAVSAQTASPTTPASGGGLEEIIVKALRVDQPLQKAPASVFVLSSEALDNADVKNFTDVAKLVPNLTFDNYYRAGIPYIALRGIPTAQGGEAPAAFIIDGAQAPGLDFINQDLIDISDIEVLRGPQGALYGRGAIAGAILVNTQQPTDDYHAKVSVTGGNGDLLQAIASGSGAIVPGMLYGKVTIEDHNFGGLIQDHGLGKPADWIREKAGRAELLFKPTESTTVELTWSHTQGDDGGSYIEMVPDGGITNFKAYQPNRNLDTRDHRSIDSYVAKLDQETPFGTFTSVSQYARSASGFWGDADWTPAPVAVQENNITVSAVNEDVRFASPADRFYQWMVGGFYQYRDTVNFLNVYGEAGGPLSGLTLDYSNEDAKSLAYAGYAQGSIDLPLAFKLTAAYRFDVDNRYDNARNTPGTGITHSFSAPQPSATLSRQFTDDILGYVTVGKGFRSGGFNAYADTLNFPGVVKRLYPKETALNYEGGFKSQFLDHRVTFNASVFHTDYRNEQYFLINISPPARDIVSLRSVTINGGEIELNYKPMAGLTLSGGLGVADSNIGSNDGINDQNKYSPDANLYTSDLAIEYTRPIGNDFIGLVRIDWQYKGPIYYDPANDYSYHAVSFFNAHATIERGNYSLSVWGKNLTDTRVPTVFNPNTFGPGIAGRMDNEPLTFGATVTAKF